MRKNKKKALAKPKPYVPMLEISNQNEAQNLLDDLKHIIIHQKKLVANAVSEFDKACEKFWDSSLVYLYEKLEGKLGFFDSYPQRIKLYNHEAIAFYMFMRDRNQALFQNRYGAFIAEIHQNLIV